MILKASQRGGGKQLGLHLLNAHDNEHVEVHEVRGFASQDVVGAFKEAYAVSKGTKCKQFLFSVSLSPPPREDVRVGAFENAIDRIEEKNGLTGQPRVVVFHEKEGRRHCHAVWSRIDADTMTARNLPFFKEKLRDISKDLYREHGWKMPRGLMDSREADPRNFTLEEWQQAKRVGLPARDLKQSIQECWAVSDSREAFTHALEERGLRLARGDRRGYVAVTENGEVLSVPRYLGKKTKEVAERLGKPDELRSVEDTKAQIAEDMTPVVRGYLDQAEAKYAEARAPLDDERRTMAANHQAERAKLDTAQQERQDQEMRERAVRFRQGIGGLWDRMTGRAGEIRKQNERESWEARQRDQDQRHRLIADQLEERLTLQDNLRELRSQHTKDMADLNRNLARFRRGDLSAMPERTKGPDQKETPQAKVEFDRQSSTPPEPPRARDGLSAKFQERLAALRSSAPEKRTTEHVRSQFWRSLQDRLAKIRADNDTSFSRDR